MKNETVPCEKCGEALRTDTVTDGTKMFLRNNNEINVCWRCAHVLNHGWVEDFDAVWLEREEEEMEACSSLIPVIDLRNPPNFLGDVVLDDWGNETTRGIFHVFCSEHDCFFDCRLGECLQCWREKEEANPKRVR